MESILRWMGGKSKSIKTILPLIPKHTLYAEPFVGAAWIMLAKPRSHCEVINDKDNNLVTFYKVVRDKPKELEEKFKYALNSRTTFSECLIKYRNNEYDDDVDQAYVFMYLNRMCFGGNMHVKRGVTYGMSSEHNTSLNYEKIDELHNRIRNVNIECKPFDLFIDVYDRPNSFMFVDPPYYESDKDYPCGKFTVSDYELLAKTLKGIEGKFMLTINAHDMFREQYSWANIMEREVTYTIENGNNTDKYGELIITNYELPSSVQQSLL